MTEPEAAHAAHDILQVLAECHRQGICYADVKPANFLLTRPYRRSGQGEDSRLLELRTTDFGCSQRIQEVCILSSRALLLLSACPEHCRTCTSTSSCTSGVSLTFLYYAERQAEQEDGNPVVHGARAIHALLWRRVRPGTMA